MFLPGPFAICSISSLRRASRYEPPNSAQAIFIENAALLSFTTFENSENSRQPTSRSCEKPYTAFPRFRPLINVVPVPICTGYVLPRIPARLSLRMIDVSVLSVWPHFLPCLFQHPFAHDV